MHNLESFGTRRRAKPPVPAALAPPALSAQAPAAAAPAAAAAGWPGAPPSFGWAALWRLERRGRSEDLGWNCEMVR